MGKRDSENTDWIAAARRRQVRINVLICGACAAALLLPILIGDRRLQSWELRMGDFLSGNRGGGEAAEQLVLVGIDDASLDVLDTLGEDEVVEQPQLDAMSFGYPFPRSVYGALAQKLLDAGAQLVVFDMLFIGEGEGDAEFKAVIEANPGRVVVGCNFVDYEVSETNTSATRPKFSLPAETVLEMSGPMDPRVGFVNFFPDADSRVRGTLFEMRAFPHESVPLRHSLAMAALKQLGEEGRIADPSAEHFPCFPKFNVVDSPYAPLPFYSLFYERDWEKNYRGGAVFEDKIVFVGGTSTVGFHDEVTIPEGDVLGVQLQMATLAATLSGDFYRPAGKPVHLLAVVLMAVAAFAIAFVMKRPVLAPLALVACAAAYLGLVRWCYFDFALLLPSAAPMLTLGLAGISCFGSRFAMEQLEKARLRRTLERQMSKELADHILSLPEDYFLSLPGVRKPVTVLFSDIRSFTARSEKDDPVELVKQLKEYLDAMVEIVFDHGGVVDKFIGDAVMAVWGNLRSHGAEVDTCNAVAAAVAMQERLAELNEKWRGEGREPFEIGIGLNHGEAIFGMMGSEHKEEMTVIGDPVNQAARLEGLTKKFGLGIIVGPQVAEFVRGQFALRSLGRVRTMGKEEAEELSAVLGEPGDAGVIDWLRRYHEALEAFSRGELEVAEAGLRSCAEEQPGDLAIPMYLEAIARGEDAGVLVMTGK